MIKNSSVIESICELGDETFAKLKSLNVPPYPKYYYETFMDGLYASKDQEMLELSKKYSYLFSSNTSHETIAENSVSLAKESLLKFQESNTTIRQISEENAVDLALLKNQTNPSQATGLFSLFSTFQDQVLKELQNAEEIITSLRREIEILERESNIDSLTKAYNKKALFIDLEEMLGFGKEKDLDLYFILFDADDFKTINENFGHIAGDKTLIYLAKLLQTALRRGTRIYRFGGQSFVVILNRIEREDAQKTVQRVLHDTSESKLFYKGNNIRLTLSGGIAAHRCGDTAQSLIDRAEKSLNRAKSDGKNCFREE
ncbi:GGDEF domain-containing protein [Sulfurospirillum sp. T05]|uniref:diguanylate cyclase n=1 Tax=Sulfurospirillum tamanense TaxID=2813362 RepID=A0ABS2WPZ9_9BACT|nr:GGDEF domain-containing protein [Sulfurospirillum tamanensis]MBN2963647.1 GGDEF domain-containing protein [Sulfurospirillum tamanensis]